MGCDYLRSMCMKKEKYLYKPYTNRQIGRYVYINTYVYMEINISI